MNISKIILNLLDKQNFFLYRYRVHFNSTSQIKGGIAWVFLGTKGLIYQEPEVIAFYGRGS